MLRCVATSKIVDPAGEFGMAQMNRNSNFLLFALIAQFLSVFTIVTAVFDIYCLSMAAPGSVHYGYYFISYEFVYVGNINGNANFKFVSIID